MPEIIAIGEALFELNQPSDGAPFRPGYGGDTSNAMIAGDANASVELRSDIGPDIYAVVKAYLGGKKDWPKWVVIPSDLHTIGDAAEMLKKKGG